MKDIFLLFRSVVAVKMPAGILFGVRVFILVIMAAAAVFAPAAAPAADITYAGNGSDLQNAPDWAFKGTPGAFFPGTTAAPESTGSRVTVKYNPAKGTTNPKYVLGGLRRTGVVSGNQVIFLDGESKYLFGGVSPKGEVKDNVVTISKGCLLTVVSGKSNDGAVTNNSVAMTGGTVQTLGGGQSFNDKVKNNSVTISGGTVSDFVFGASTDCNGAENNSVTISGGKVSGYIIGGDITEGDAANNSVIISGGTVSASIMGGESSKGDAANNSVTISGGTVSDCIMGGESSEGDAVNNSVTISGGKVSGEIYGGHVLPGGNKAINNTITLSGSPDLQAAALFGGGGDGTEDAFTGNTLKVMGFTGPVKSLNNFEHYEFLLPETLGNGGTMLTTLDPDSSTNLTGSTVDIGFFGGSTPLRAGDSIALIDRTIGGLVGAPVTEFVEARQGVSLIYKFKVLTQDNKLLALLEKPEDETPGEPGEVPPPAQGTDGAPGACPPCDPYAPVGSGPSVRLNPQTKALSEGRLSGLAFMNQGADLLVARGMESALRATEKGRPAAFGVMEGGSSRYDSGSHVNVEGFSLVTGLVWSEETSLGAPMLGGFFEGGWGNYNTHNSFVNAAGVKGDGDTEYYGGGLLARHDFPQGFYVEGTGRAGNIRTRFSSGDLRSPAGEKAHYRSSSAYFGAHGGLGYIWQISEKAALNVSSKYIWNHQGSDSVKVAGDPIHFKAANSHRWRTGARFSYALNEQIRPYIGAAYDHEFDGKVRATAYREFSIKSPNLRGGTGVGELGVRVFPMADSGVSFDLGVQGYTGVRQGVTGSLQLKWEF